jgi:DNA-binding MarR family transcriptional regulator
MTSRVGPPPSAIEREVGLSLQRFAHWAEAASTYAARRLGLHVTDLTCIGYLDTQPGPVSVKQVIEYLGISSGSGTGLIDRLEKAGYVRRIRNPDDRRGVLIELVVDRSKEPLAFYRRLQLAFSDAARPLDDGDLHQIVSFLDRLASVDPTRLVEEDQESVEEQSN